MTPGSTKSQIKAQRRKRSSTTEDPAGEFCSAKTHVMRQSVDEPADADDRGSELSDRAYFGWSVVVMAVALVLRLYRLEMKPLHHDEGVNGFFFTRLFRENIYQYDPANYHGPSLYYLTLPFTGALGLETLALRLTTVVFGAATVWVVLHLRRYIGSIGALVAAMLVAVSPGAVYLSRYYIHESLFVFFTLATIVAALHFYENADETGRYDSRAGTVGAVASVALVLLALFLVYYRASISPQAASIMKLSVMIALVVTVAALHVYAGARAVHLIFAFIAAALLFATKETAFISAGVVALAAILAHSFVKIKENFDDSTSGSEKHKSRGSMGKKRAPHESAVHRFGDWPQFTLALGIGAGLFLFLNILLYSSFFTNARGVADSLSTFAFWTATGKSDFHRKEFTAYVKWLWQEEGAILVLGAIGACFALWRARRGERFGLFAAAWAFGILVAYSLVPYKTPWLALNFIVPLAITSGYAIDALGRSHTASASSPAQFSTKRVLALALAALAVSVGVYQSVRLNFVFYDDERYPYVYAHTQRGVLPMIERIDELARRAGTGHDTRIAIYSPEYWPLPWYLREYDPRTAFHGRMAAPTGESLLVLSAQQARDESALIDADYQEIDSYPLRPGVTLVLYARRDLIER